MAIYVAICIQRCEDKKYISLVHILYAYKYIYIYISLVFLLRKIAKCSLNFFSECFQTITLLRFSFTKWYTHWTSSFHPSALCHPTASPDRERLREGRSEGYFIVVAVTFLLTLKQFCQKDSWEGCVCSCSRLKGPIQAKCQHCLAAFWSTFWIKLLHIVLLLLMDFSIASGVCALECLCLW